MLEDPDPHDVAQLLRMETAEEIPPPSPDLIARTIGRVRNWILLGDLLRLATLGGFWKSDHADDSDAQTGRSRQDQ